MKYQHNKIPGLIVDIVGNRWTIVKNYQPNFKGDGYLIEVGGDATPLSPKIEILKYHPIGFNEYTKIIFK